MPKWEVKYRTPNAGASHSQHFTIEAKDIHAAKDKFQLVYPLEEIISIVEVVH
jgi:hypothetical protein